MLGILFLMTIPERMRRLRRRTGLLSPAEAATEGRGAEAVVSRLDGREQRERFTMVVSAAIAVRQEECIRVFCLPVSCSCYLILHA